MKTIKTYIYNLETESGYWLGQIVMTSDGMFAGVTDYGNLSFAWRSFGDKDFREFILGIDEEYFGGKMYQGIAYMVLGEKYRKSCMRFAKEILPALKKAIQLEFEQEPAPLIQ